ncbi:MAG TPA: DUF2844 domain-containing protein [Candidatus Binatia bacterium]|nr:DUF2844 domain-containing protein [Candidatus Binatia bacterium]
MEVALGVALFATSAWATLGQKYDSVKADQQRMAGELRSQQFSNYTVHEISQPDGHLVREYVSPAGVVFGVVWDGPTMPNLSQLLGPYFDQLQKAIPTSGPRRRGPLYVQTGALVVSSGGHLGSFHGRAYLINLIPTGLTEAVLR